MTEDHDFTPQLADACLREDLVQLLVLATREDVADGCDLTTLAVVPPGIPARASIASRAPGIACGVDLLPWVAEALGGGVRITPHCGDGDAFDAGAVLATLEGDARDVLTSERIVLNLLGRLCGIATWTRRHVEVIEGLSARLYDTRKTTPGWRRLEKYAVRCGGGHNHRGGLYDAILIKDNHLACHERGTGRMLSPSEAVELARRFLEQHPDAPPDAIVEIEVDTIEQFADALVAGPDIVLLDNMTNDELREAVRRRDAAQSSVQLEASGGVHLDTLRAIAQTGVDRISVGALTHSAVGLDLGLDWDLSNPSYR